MATLRFPFSHAIQYTSNGTTTTQETVQSGDLKLGYDRVSNYSRIDKYLTRHYWVEMYFDVPADLYKYTCNAYFVRNFRAEVSSRKYYYNEISSHPEDSYYSNEDTGPSITDNYNFSPVNYSEASTKFVPDGLVSNYPFLLNENAIKNTQDHVPDSYVVNTYYTGEYNDKGVAYESSVLKVHEIDCKLVTFKDVEDYYLEVNVVPVETQINPVYPVDVYASNSADLTVAWDVSDTANRGSSYIYPVSSTVTVTDANSHTLTKSITGTDTSCVFTTTQLASLDVGQCSVVVSVTDNYGNVATKTWTFNLVGESTAPEITYVTGQAFPRVYWSASSQSGFEIKISNEHGVAYESGLISDSSSRNYVVPKMINHGKYSIEMRCLNEYGIFTSWTSYYWKFSRDAGQFDDPFNVSARPDLGILVKNPDQWSIWFGVLYVIRRKDENSEPEVLGQVDGLKKAFIDYTLGLNDPHQYAFRLYNTSPDFQDGGGYTDSHWIDGVLAYDGVVIRDAEDYSNFVHVWMSENRTIDYIHNDNRSDTLVQCVGRKFPISERGEWQTSVRNFSGFVSDEDFLKLKNMKLNSSHVLMQAQKEFFPCHMEYSDNGDYVDGGRIISFQMTRIDGDK